MTRNEETHVRAILADPHRPVCVNADSARAWLSLAMGEVDDQRKLNLLLAERLEICSRLLSRCADRDRTELIAGGDIDRHAAVCLRSDGLVVPREVTDGR